MRKRQLEGMWSRAFARSERIRSVKSGGRFNGRRGSTRLLGADLTDGGGGGAQGLHD